jgi:hypothetical protein
MTKIFLLTQNKVLLFIFIDWVSQVCQPFLEFVNLGFLVGQHQQQVVLFALQCVEGLSEVLLGRLSVSGWIRSDLV